MTAIKEDRNARRAIAAALGQVRDAAQAFAAAVREGRNGMREYLAWERTAAEARRAAAVPAQQFEARYQARLSEYRALLLEARHLETLAPRAGKIVGRGGTLPEVVYSVERHEAACGEWLERASAYSGKAVTRVSPDSVLIDPIPRGADRPVTVSVPGPPGYLEALRQAVAGG